MTHHERAPIILWNQDRDEGINQEANVKGDSVSGQTEGANLIDKVKAAGKAGIISYVFWELIFWGVSLPVAVYAFIQTTGHFPDISDKSDLAKLGTEAIAVVNLARLANPLRLALALGSVQCTSAYLLNSSSLATARSP
jgi:hypothetical protein